MEGKPASLMVGDAFRQAGGAGGRIQQKGFLIGQGLQVRQARLFRDDCPDRIVFFQSSIDREDHAQGRMPFGHGMTEFTQVEIAMAGWREQSACTGTPYQVQEFFPSCSGTDTDDDDAGLLASEVGDVEPGSVGQEDGESIASPEAATKQMSGELVGTRLVGRPAEVVSVASKGNGVRLSRSISFDASRKRLFHAGPSTLPERAFAHLIANRDHGWIGHRAALPVRTVDHQGVSGDELPPRRGEKGGGPTQFALLSDSQGWLAGVLVMSAFQVALDVRGHILMGKESRDQTVEGFGYSQPIVLTNRRLNLV